MQRELVQEAMDVIVNKYVKFHNNQIRNEVARVMTALGHVRMSRGDNKVTSLLICIKFESIYRLVVLPIYE